MTDHTPLWSYAAAAFCFVAFLVVFCAVGVAVTARVFEWLDARFSRVVDRHVRRALGTVTPIDRYSNVRRIDRVRKIGGQG